MKKHCEGLLESSQKISSIKLDDSDDLGFMSACFLSKQTDHMFAIIRLLPHADIQLISRSMIEGLVQLHWCFKYPEQAFIWRGFAWVHDWRLSRDMAKIGRCGDPEHINRINDFIIEHGESFKKKKYKGKSPSDDVDPYHQNWRCGTSLKEMAEIVDGEQLYTDLYSPYSDWQHWGVGSMGEMLDRSNEVVSYRDNVKSNLCSSLAVAFQCLYEVVKLNNLHHSHGMEKNLDRILSEYIAMHQA
jgi:hypothetical protein